MICRLPARAVPVVAAYLLATALSAPAALADENDTVVSRDDIARQLGFARDRAIRPTADTSSPAPPRLRLDAIQFEFNSDRLTAMARNQIAELAAALRLPSLQRFSFAVMGHTDSVGGSAYNRDLSLRRARSVKRSLVTSEVNAGRLVELGLGEDYPISGTRGNDAQNRRVEIINLGTGIVALHDAAAVPTSALPSARDGRHRKGRALLIGIDRYRYVSPLIGTVNDARAMKDYVSSHLGFSDRDVRLLLDGEATRDNILRAIAEWLIEGTRQGDDVFLFYSGHGFQQRDDNGDETDRLDETLVPVDVTVDGNGVPRGMITDDEMAALLAQLPGRRVQVVIDACHSGTSDRLAIRNTGAETWRYVKTPRMPDGAPLHIGVARTRAIEIPRPAAQESFVSTKDLGADRLDITVWAAVRADQKALVDEEMPSNPGSVFTRRLLWGARDRKADSNADGIVTRSELHVYLIRESEAYCARHPVRCGKGLTPQLHTESGGMQRVAFSSRQESERAFSSDAVVAKDIPRSPGGAARGSEPPWQCRARYRARHCPSRGEFGGCRRRERPGRPSRSARHRSFGTHGADFSQQIQRAQWRPRSYPRRTTATGSWRQWRFSIFGGASRRRGHVVGHRSRTQRASSGAGFAAQGSRSDRTSQRVSRRTERGAARHGRGRMEARDTRIRGRRPAMTPMPRCSRAAPTICAALFILWGALLPVSAEAQGLSRILGGTVGGSVLRSGTALGSDRRFVIVRPRLAIADTRRAGAVTQLAFDRGRGLLFVVLADGSARWWDLERGLERGAARGEGILYGLVRGTGLSTEIVAVRADGTSISSAP